MTKNEILSSILPLASKEGLRNLSRSRMAENAGIAKSTLYSHFSSKDEMINDLYLYIRQEAKKRKNIGLVDYGEIVKGKSLKDVLTFVVDSYNSIIRDKDMKDFYAIIDNEKSISKVAASIITERIAHFPSIEGASLLFASAIHSILCLSIDDETAGTEVSKGVMEKTINEFSRIYEVKKEVK